MPTIDNKLQLADFIASGNGASISPADPMGLNSAIAGAGDGLAVAGLSIATPTGPIDAIVVGTAGDDDKDVDAGRVFVVLDEPAGSATTLGGTATQFIIDGVNAGDAAGAAVAAIADLNGDGRAEILVGAPGADAGSALDAGRTYVVWGKTTTTGVDLGDLEKSGGPGYSVVGEAAGDASGSAVAAIADGNGDGKQEVLVGAAGNDEGGLDAGAAYVVFGKSSTGVVSLGSLGSGGYKIIGENAGDAAGAAVAGVGDQNGDGKGDVLVGAAGNDAGGADAGAVYVVFNKGTAAAVNLDAVAAGSGGYKIVGQAGEGAGATVADIGDVNGDGKSDILVGTANGDTAYVVFGKSDTAEVHLTDVAAGVGGFAIHGENAGDLTDISIAGGVDLNGDGISDFLIGTRHNAEGGFDAGAVYAVWGGGTASVDLASVASGIGGAKIVGTAGSQTGSDVAIVGDVNNDGVRDIAIGSAGSLTVSTVYTPTNLWVPETSVYGTENNDDIGPGYGGGHKVGDGDDNILAGGGNDIVDAAGGNDTIDGGSGQDTLSGGTGDDTFLVDDAADVVHEAVGGGNDTIIATGNYSLGAGEEIETLVLAAPGSTAVGNELANHIVGTDGGDVIDGGGGADVLEGMGGDDSYIVTDAAAQVVEAAGGGTDTVHSSVDLTLAANVENLDLTVAGHTGHGNELDNHLTGSSGHDVLYGDLGNDTIDGGGDADLMIGGSGDDTYFVDNPGDVVVENSGEGFDTVVVSTDWTLADNIEAVHLVGTGHELTGNSAGNKLEGDTGNDTIDGGAGDDSELGGDGNDHLISTSGHDTLVGGAGDDVYVIHGGSAHIEDFQGHDAIDASEATGDSYIDLSGKTESEVEHEVVHLGGGGTVTTALDVQFLQDLTGSFADDIANVQTLVPQIVAALQTFQPASEFGVSTFRDKPIDPFGATDDWVYDTLLPLSTSSANLTSAYNAMIANNGNDGPEAQLEALMQLALRANGEVGFQSNAARFVVLFTDAEYHSAGDGALAGITNPNNGDAVLDGNGLGEDYPLIAQVKAALEGANIIPIFAVAGGAGLEGIYQGLAGSLGRGTVVTIAADSSNVVQAITTGLTAATTTHIADATGGVGNDHLIGNAADNVLTGNDGNDSLAGAEGRDTLIGGAGSDRLEGGDGNDRLDGGSGTDTAVYSGAAADYSVTTLASGDVEVRELATGAIDTLVGVELVAFSDTTMVLGPPPANTPPSVSGPVLAQAVEDGAIQAVSALSTATDADGNALSVVLDATPLPAGIVFDAATQSFIVDPADASFQALGAGQVSTITIAYGVTDGTDTTPASLVLTVTGTNDAAVVSSAAVTLDETDAALSASGHLTITDIDSDASFVAQTDTAGTYGTFSISADGNWTFLANSALDSLNPGNSVQDVFTVAAADGTSTSVTVTINGTAEALVISGDLTGSAIEDELTVVTGHALAADRFGTAGSFVATTGPIAGAYGSLEITQSGDWRYVLDNSNPAVQGLERTTSLVDHITVEAADGTTADIAITIGGIEETGSTTAPIYGTFGNDVISGTTGDDVIYGLDGNDLIRAGDGNDTINGGFGRDSVDAGAGDDLIVVGGGTNGPMRQSSDPVDGGTGYDTVLLEGNQGDFHIVHIVGASPQINATDLRTGQTAVFANVEMLSFTDGSSIVMTPRNVAPVVSGPLSLVAAEDGASLSVSALGNASDANGDPLTAIVDTAALPAGITYDAATQSFTLDPANAAFQSLGVGQSANLSIAYAVSDGALSVATTLQVTVSGTNDLPLISGNVVTSAIEGGAVVWANPLANASDVDAGDVLKIVDLPPSLPAGVSYDAATGRFAFNPADPAYSGLAAGQTQDVVVNYAVSDGHASVAANVVFTITGAGADPDQVLTGTSAANTLVGGSGNDTLDGKGGADLMIGHAGNDTYYVNNVGDRVVEATNEGNDTVISTISYTLTDNVESLRLSGSTNISGTGNALDNVIVGNSGANILDGAGGDDQLTGGAGNDKLIGGEGNDRLDGGSGADTMIGGNGNDRYVVNSTADVVVETGSSGHDIVQSSISFSLSDLTHAMGAIEDITLNGTAATSATGSALANILSGNGSANVLSGLGGDDTLIGGGGADKLIGGQGADHFVFNAVGGGIDTITDFASGTDRIEISASGFGGGLTAGEVAVLQSVANVGLAHSDSAHGFFILDNSGANAGTIYFDATGGTTEDAVALCRIGASGILGSDFLIA